MLYYIEKWHNSSKNNFPCISRGEIAKTGGGNNLVQPAITCSKLTIEALEQGVKYVQN